MANGISTVALSLIKRNAIKRGPTSSDAWNDSWDENISDLAGLSNQWNNQLIPLLSALPNGTNDLDAFGNGLDGRTLYVDKTSVGTVSDTTYWNGAHSRPNSIKDQFVSIYTKMATMQDTLEAEILAAGANSIDTTVFIKKDGSVAMTGQLQASSGAVGGPGYTFSGDLTTGVYRPVANSLALTAGGTERLRVDTSGTTVTGNTTISGNLVLTGSTTNLTIGGKLNLGPQALSIPDSGDINPAAYTLTPTFSSVRLTNNDADGANVTISTSGAVDGQTLRIFNVGTNSVTIKQSATVRLSGAVDYVMGIDDSITLEFVVTKWTEVSRSNN